MWIKKTREEINKTNPTKAFPKGKASLVLGIILGTMCLFSNGGGGIARGEFFVPLYEIPSRIPSAFIFAFIVSIGSYILAKKSDSSPPHPIVLICPNCEKVKFDDGVLECECGGHFEDSKTMKWIEDHKT